MHPPSIIEVAADRVTERLARSEQRRLVSIARSEQRRLVGGSRSQRGRRARLAGDEVRRRTRAGDRRASGRTSDAHAATSRPGYPGGQTPLRPQTTMRA